MRNASAHLRRKPSNVKGAMQCTTKACSAWRLAAVAAIAALCAIADAATRATLPPSPSALFDGLFRDVAISGIFSDFKEFVDATPRSSPSAILSKYRAQRPASRSALLRFVQSNFIFEPETSPAALPPRGLPLLQHISELWPRLTRPAEASRPYSSILPLPAPYVVPGGRFRELYYWDSYFTMLGFGPTQRSLRDDIVSDFVYEIHTYGFIPNANRTYYLSRSQPPFFFKMIGLLAPGAEAKAYARYLPELKEEHAFWMLGAAQVVPGHPARNVVMMPDHSLLNRYWDANDTPRDESYGSDLTIARGAHDPAAVYRNIRAAAESGWDFSSRWLADGKSLQTIDTTSIVPVDLNSILFGLETAIRSGCAEVRDTRCEEEFSAAAEHRRAAMEKYLWNAKDGVFDDYRWTDGRRLGHVTAAAFYPMFFGLSSAQEAHRTARAATSLIEPGGLATTLAATGQQWDAPNGWAPLQWIAVSGLRSHGETMLARTIACRWIATVSRVYAHTGRLLEKYDVITARPGGGGEYKLQDGFGWTNGVTAALLKLYPHCVPSSMAPN
jgi:alpha,alpha-trehalase